MVNPLAMISKQWIRQDDMDVPDAHADYPIFDELCRCLVSEHSEPVTAHTSTYTFTHLSSATIIRRDLSQHRAGALV